MVHVFTSNPLLIHHINSHHSGTMWLAHDIPVIHIIVPKAFLRYFLHTNYALNPLIRVYACHLLVIHQGNLRHRGIMWLVRDIQGVHIIIPKAFFISFLDKNCALNPLIHVFASKPLRDAPMAVHATVTYCGWPMVLSSTKYPS